MPPSIHIERMTAITACQFDYLEPSSGKKLFLKDINVKPYALPNGGEKVAGRFFWASGWSVTVQNVWAAWADKGLPGVQDGVPPGGDFVDPSKVGMP